MTYDDYRMLMLELSLREPPEKPIEDLPAETVKSIKLYYTELPKHDKVYFIDIVREPKFKDAWFVDFKYGRRGKTLKPGRKTKIAVSLKEASMIFDSLVSEKKAEGYTENISGVPFSK